MTVHGRVWDDGTVTEVVATAGQVRLADASGSSVLAAWRGAGRVRNAVVRHVEPSVQGAHLLRGAHDLTEVAACPR
jgi:hypothetical protein